MARLADTHAVFEEAVRDFPGRLFVACSGGADSNRVLQVAAQCAPDRVTVCHFDHAWSSASGDWCSQVKSQTEALGLPFVSQRATEPNATELEARKARYAWFETLLSPGDVLLLGHHRLDQLETRWMRVTQGRPPRGMPGCRQLGSGWLVRPFLELDPLHDASAIQDPANQDPSYRRVQIRMAIQHAETKALAQLERLGRAIDRLESAALSKLPNGPYAFDAALDPGHQRHAIALWVWRQARLAAPPAARLTSLLSQLPAAPDRHPVIQWEDQGQRWAIRTYRGRLYLEPAVWTGPPPIDGWVPLGVGRARDLHALHVPPWQRPWVWQYADQPSRLRRWFPKVSPVGQISLEYIELND